MNSGTLKGFHTSRDGLDRAKPDLPHATTTTLRGRFAPSPTGRMHLGNARTALLAWLDARSRGGKIVLRIEDLDAARVKPGAEAALLQDLAWLGLDWDEGPVEGGPFVPYRQSERTPLYDAAVDRLLASKQAFLCACSRTDVARAASAPHAPDEEGPRYPGTCRDRDPTEVGARAAAHGRAPTVRFMGLDDFVLRRADGVAAYQLAVVVDDAAMAISRVVRGDDLASSTPRQLALFRALDLPPPEFAHVPLLLAPTGERLAKRTRPESVASLRARGLAAEQVVGALAASAGLCPPRTRVMPEALAGDFDLDRIVRGPSVIGEDAWQ